MPEQTRDLPSVSDTIADYNTAIEADDRVVASRMLEALEDAAYANEADWHVTSNFLQRNGLNARLEIVTKILIRTIRPQSARPYLLLANLTAGAGRLDEARSFMTQYREFFGDIPAERWDVLNAYFVVEDYPRCLEVTEIGLAETPNNLPWYRRWKLAVVCQYRYRDPRAGSRAKDAREVDRDDCCG
jgi:hypothetical protein